MSAEQLHVTINEGWVQSHPPGTRWEDADGRPYIVDNVKETGVIPDVDDPRMTAPLWVVTSHPAGD
jgi:hypothetical protein